MSNQLPINPTTHGHYYRFLGQVLRQHRKKKGLSQSELIDALGTSSVNYISRLERQDELTQPSLEFLFATADVLGIKPYMFFEDAPTPETKACVLESALIMLKRGDSIEKVAEALPLISVEELKVLKKHLM